tara:strand:- start:111 stop:455 length:345 start_codon:yes stop_codon:yes gene_type:complete
MKIYHNPRCRKSREALAILNDHNINVEIIEYLKTPLTKQNIKSILKKLGCKALDLVRKEEKLFKDLYRGKKLTEEDWVDVLCQNPILIQRPIIMKDNTAVIGRPPINVLDLLNK